MIRKLAFALAATAALGTASLAVTTGSAEAKGGWGGHHHHFHGHGHGGWGRGWGRVGFYGPAYVGVYGGGGCYVRRAVPTPWGYRVRLVNVCY